MGDKSNKTVSVGVGLDLSLFKKGAKEIVKVVSQMTSMIAKEFARMSNFKIAGYTPIAERQKEFTYEGTAAYEQSLNKKLIDLEKERTKEVKRRQKLLDAAKTEKTKQKHSQAIESIKTEYDTEIAKLQGKIDNLSYKDRKRIGELADPVRTKFSNKIKDGIEISKEEQYERYLPLVEKAFDKKGKEVDLLTKEVQTVKTIRDLRKKTEKVLTRNVVLQEKMTNSGKKYEVIADDTVETEKKLTKEQLKNAKTSGKKGPVGTFFSRFKSVAIYRAIRGLLKEIVTAFKEGLSGLALKDSAFNESFSQITSSLEKVKASMSVAFYSILVALQPLITSLSNVVVHFANAISYLSAKIQGQNTFLKVNEEYLKNYRDSLNATLLEFDTFTTMQQNGPDYEKLFDKTKIEDFSLSFDKVFGDLNVALENLTGIDNALNAIIITLGTLAGVGIIKWIVSGGLKTLLLEATPVVALIGAVYSIIEGISDILNWDEATKGLNDFQKGLKAVLTTLQIVFGVVAAIAAVKAIINPTGATIGLAIAGTVATFATSALNKKVTGYANGGNFRTGDFFVANENGNTELIASSNSGGGSVMNLDQWEQVSEIAFFNALDKYGAAQNGGNGLDIDKLGTAIARSNGFRNEMNRRNASLNLV